MGWIKERILAEHRKFEKSGLDWAKIAEQKIVGTIIKDLKDVHRKTGIHIPSELFAISELGEVKG